MKRALSLACVFTAVVASAPAVAQSKHDHCVSYARQAAASAPTSTGPVRGAARGAVGGAIFGNAGAGAGVGAIVGTARRANQKNQSYQFYYDQCMAR
jgi:uncharacterized membrane protein